MNLLSSDYLDKQAYRRHPLLRLAGLAVMATLLLQFGFIAAYVWSRITIGQEEQRAADLSSAAEQIASRKAPLKETGTRREFITAATPTLKGKVPAVALLAHLEQQIKPEFATEEIVYRVEEQATDASGIVRAKVISLDVAGVAKKGADPLAAFGAIFPDATVRSMPASSRRAIPADAEAFRILARWQGPPMRQSYGVKEVPMK